MNKEVEKKAKNIWEWEKTLSSTCFPDVKTRASKEIQKIMDSCTDEELFLIDDYIMKHCAGKT